MQALGNTPVLVGAAVSARREEDWRKALEPIELMLESARAAGYDSGVPSILRGLQWIAVPKGRWSYSDPAGHLADSLGASGARSVLGSVGVLQQSLVAEACARIARGESHTTMVVGADAGYRLQRAALSGQQVTETEAPGEPHEYWQPAEELRHPVEKRVGLRMPVGLYAWIDSAWRAARGLSLGQHREDTARMLASFSRVAAANPFAWRRREFAADEIRESSSRNPMMAFPYTRMHCSSWSVDQGAALIFCSVDRARALGIDPSRWVFPLASAESNHMVPVIARAAVGRCIGAELAARAALEAAGVESREIDLVDLYSCFPVAVRVHAEAAGIELDRTLTITGGMPFAGGPYNNYQLQSIARAARLLREGHGKTALVSGVSGVLTKHGFGVWGLAPPPARFERIDVTTDVAKAADKVPVEEQYQGTVSVAASTVLYESNQSARLLALFDAPNGARGVAVSADPGWIAEAEQDGLVGRRVRVVGQELAR